MPSTLLFFSLSVFFVVNGQELSGGKTSSEHGKARTLLLSLEKLDAEKAAVAAKDREAVNRYQTLLRGATPFLEMKELPSVVNNEYTPPGATKNDYVSFSTYYWPDPEKSDGLPFIKKDGEPNHDWLRAEKGHDQAYLRKMVEAVEKLVLAGYLGDDTECNEKAIQILRCWFLDPKTRMNPHLQYSQAVMGRDTGSATGVIDTHRFYGLIEMLGLLEACPEWTEKDREGMKRWFTEFLDWLRTSKFGKRESQAVNNHGSWYDVQTAAFAWYVGKDDLVKEILEGSKARIDSQIEKDGSQPHELRRTIPFTYSCMNLRPLILLAKYADRYKIDLWDDAGAEGGSIRAAYEFLRPYAEEQKPWPYKDLRFNPKTFDGVYRLAGDRFGAAPAKLKSLSDNDDFETFIR